MKKVALKKGSKLREIIKQSPEIKYRRNQYNTNLSLLGKRYKGHCKTIIHRSKRLKSMAEHSNRAEASIINQARKTGII